VVFWIMGHTSRGRIGVLRTRDGIRWAQTVRREQATLEGLKRLENDSERFGGTLGLSHYFTVAVTHSEFQFWAGSSRDPYIVSRRPLDRVRCFELEQIELKATWSPACVVVVEDTPDIRVPLVLTSAWEVWPLGRRSTAQVVAELNRLLE
ncbi:MAG: hypothetical protein Q7T71_06060, partial [Herbiconiux sp.]|nr:hypothetical protein [Herbiconiux sp.]